MHEIETERLLLRFPKTEDTDAMLPIRNSEFVQKYNAMRIIDRERMFKIIEKDRENKTALYLVEKAGGRVIGGIWTEPDKNRYDVKSKYLSFYLDEPFARQGYMKEALTAVVDMLFTTHPELAVVASSTFKGNIASQRLLQSVGFVYEGCIRKAVRTPRGEIHDDVQFSVLREEWK